MLKEENVVSGEKIKTTLDISRTAVWKHIQGLNALGYEIKTVKGSGYQLKHVPDFLYPWELDFSLKPTFSFSHFHEVDSTNKYARQLVPPHIVLAEKQQAGKGRLGRAWFSTPGGIYLSFVIQPNCAFESVPALPLVVAVSLTKVMRSYRVPAEIKWPNDIQVNGKKIAGILVELSGETDMPEKAVIGVGVNVNQSIYDYPYELQQYVTSMRDIFGTPLPRLPLLNHILEETTDLLTHLNQRISDILDIWKEYSCTLGKFIKVRQIDRIITGVAEDIDEKGALMIKTSQGREKIYSGDIVQMREQEKQNGTKD